MAVMKAILGRTLVAAAALFSFGTSAFANCTLNDLEGTWTAYFHGSSDYAAPPVYFSCNTFNDSKGVMYCMGPDGYSQQYLSKFTLVDGASCSYSFVARLTNGDFKFNATLNQNTNILVGVNTENSYRGSPFYMGILIRTK
jgi:hypothetical protein